MTDKKKKKVEQVIAAIIERGIDDVCENMYGNSITCDDAELMRLYEICYKAITDINAYIRDKYPDAFA